VILPCSMSEVTMLRIMALRWPELRPSFLPDLL
jgi:hypothetical protein